MENLETKMTPRQIVTDFLHSLEFNEYDLAFELEQCSNNPDARRYWVDRSNGDIK